MNLIKNYLRKISRQTDNLVDYESIVPQIQYNRDDNKIPKKLFQTYRSRNLPKEIEDNINKIKSMNPDWSYHLYTDQEVESYIIQYYGKRIYSYYKRITDSYGAAKADFFRYLLLYREGGIYLDVKSSCINPLTQISNKISGFLLTHWDNEMWQKHPNVGILDVPEFRKLNLPRGEYIQWAIVTCPGHPFLRNIIKQVLYNIDHYNPYEDWVCKESVLRITGPIAYTTAIINSLQEINISSFLKNITYTKFHDYTELGFIYSIYEDTNYLYQHYEIKNEFGKRHYSNSFQPLIKHRSKYVSFLNFIYFKLVEWNYTIGNKKHVSRI